MDCDKLNDAKQFFLEALKASKPSQLVQQYVTVDEEWITIGKEKWEHAKKEKLYIIAVGKAASPMAQTLKHTIGVDASSVICITPDEDPNEEYCLTSSHPVPDQKSEQAAVKLIQFIEAIPDESSILFALSGGASALICKTVDGVSLQNINTINQLLLESGANIEEINGVRKHLSAIKGGQLLRYFKPNCMLVDLVISDVPGDNLEIIGSGPTTPDSSTFQDAYDTLLRYDLWDQCPESVRSHIEKGLTGEVPETIKPGRDPLEGHQSYIIGSARKFAENAAAIARNSGFNPWVAEQAYNQPVQQVAAQIIEIIKAQKEDTDQPKALIFYGESTVEVTGGGKGGRNQELALQGALKVKDMEDVTWLSAGTDGIDGPTDAAGAVVDGDTIRKAKEQGVNAQEYLKNNDSYHFHERVNTLLKTGATGNNVMDVVIILIG